jgi:hypothetical protein
VVEECSGLAVWPTLVSTPPSLDRLDLVAGCRDLNHLLYPSERIAFLRDTLIGLSEYRRQDRRYFSPISIAVQVLIGYQGSVRQAQAMVGDPVDTAPYDSQAKANLTEAELENLAARCILERPPTGATWSGFVSARATSSG